VLSGMTFNGLATIQVFQWVKSGTYNGNITYSLNGGTSSLLTPIGIVQDTGNGAWWQYDANLGASLGLSDTVKISSTSGGAIIDRLTVVPEPATMIASVILLVPFALSTLRVLRRQQTA